MPELNSTLQRLDAIIRRASSEQSLVGCFAVLYLHVSRRIDANLRAGEFQHPQLLATLAVNFAERYFQALDDFRAGRPTSGAWQCAFAANLDHGYLIAQQLLVAANAHINFDLGISVGATVPVAQLDSFRADYDRVNAILGEELGALEAALGRIWPPFRVVNALLHPLENGVIDLVMRIERDRAWTFAMAMATAEPSARPGLIAARDAQTVALAHAVTHPPWTVRVLCRVVHACEPHRVNRIISILSDGEFP